MKNWTHFLYIFCYLIIMYYRFSKNYVLQQDVVCQKKKTHLSLIILWQTHEASKVFEHLVSLGLKPNAKSYAVLIEAHLINRDVKSALAVIDDMVFTLFFFLRKWYIFASKGHWCISNSLAGNCWIWTVKRDSENGQAAMRERNGLRKWWSSTITGEFLQLQIGLRKPAGHSV